MKNPGWDLDHPGPKAQESSDAREEGKAVVDSGGSHRLIDAAGNVRLGIFAEPIHEINHGDCTLTDPFGSPIGRFRRHFAFKQFQFLGALSERLIFGCAIADVKYVATAFVYFYEPETRRLSEYSFKLPLGIGARLDQRPEHGMAFFRSGRNRIVMSGGTAPRERKLTIRLTRGVSVEAVFSEEDPPMHPMAICTKAGAQGWVFARKTAGLGVAGVVQWNGTKYDLEKIHAYGHHDWSAGYMRRHTFWNWGCLAGRVADGRVVGLNVSCGVNETSFTENCFWVDGQLHKLDTVYFDYDPSNLTRPWRITSFDGRLHLEFHPEGKHAECINAWIVASNFNQLFGRYRGSLETATGDHIVVDGMLGYVESHYAKW